MMRRACSRLGGVPALSSSRPSASQVRLPPGSCSSAAVVSSARHHASEAGAADGTGRGRVWRWGGPAGIGFNKEATESSQEPSQLEGHTDATGAACGGSHSAFICEGGQLYTYGSNKFQQLGHENPGEEKEPAGVEPAVVGLGGEAVAQVSLGSHHSAAVTKSGELWTWGWGGSFWSGPSGLGLGSRETAVTPVRVEKFAAADEKVKQVACGGQHTLALTEKGVLYSTGKGEFGRLGHGDTRDELEFEEVTYFTEADDSILAPGEPTTIVKVGAGNSFCAALSSGGELWVWGRNDQGQLGLGEEAMGDLYSAERFPRLVRSLPQDGLRVVDFACGEHQIVVLTDTGVLYEWGARTWLEPRQVHFPEQYEESLKKVVKLAAGEKFTFALTEDGTLFSWGTKSSGCLAQGPDSPKNVLPTPISATTFAHQKVVDIVAGKNRCMAITLEDTYVA